MELNSPIFDYRRNCGVKIVPTIKGVRDPHCFGSGVLYVTPNTENYNYVISAKHTLQESSKSGYDAKSISQIELFYPVEDKFELLTIVKGYQIEHDVITFEKDIVIIKIPKSNKYFVPQILVADYPNFDEENFISWGTFAANPLGINLIEFKKNDFSEKRYQAILKFVPSEIKGISGAGLFSSTRPCLFGVISKHPTENGANQTIDLTKVSFNEINRKLESLGYVQLDTIESRKKKIIDNRVVDLYQVPINGVILNLELARKRFYSDINDDWYHDSLKYVDLLSSDYLFKQFEDVFHDGTFKYMPWELFYVPKKKVSHRKALVGSFADRLLYMALVGELASNLDKALLPNVFSARFNEFSNRSLILSGVEQWKKMNYKLLEEILFKEDDDNFKHGCYVEIDILNFYDNINLEILKDKIYRVCNTKNEINATEQLILLLGNVSTNQVGVPQNSDASSLLASFYLNQIDVTMRALCPSYYRFMDDIKIFCEDKYQARRFLQILEFELKEINLSINSQKTVINELKDEEHRNSFIKCFNYDLLMLNRLINSNDSYSVTEAFHLSIKLIKENLVQNDVNDEATDSARKLNFALTILKRIIKTDISLCNDEFIDVLLNAVKAIKDSPWITYQVSCVLNFIPKQIFAGKFLSEIKPLVLDKRYNTFSYQVYQLWMLLAKQKCFDEGLQSFASTEISKNDQTNQPGIAGMIVYICSINANYSKIISTKINNGDFNKKFFLCRTALITQRKMRDVIINPVNIHPSLKHAPSFTNKYGHKDFVYIQGEFDDFDEIEFEPLFSL